MLGEPKSTEIMFRMVVGSERIVGRLLAGNLLSAIGNGLTLPLLVVYLGTVRGLGVTTAGLLVAFIAAITLVEIPLVGWMVDKYGPRPVLMGGVVVSSAGCVSLTQVTSLATAMFATLILATGSSFVWSPQSSLYGRLVPPEGRQRIFGLQFMLLNLGLGLGGVVAAILIGSESANSFVVLYLVDATTYLGYFLILLTLSGVGVGPGRSDDEPERGPGIGGYREVLRDKTLRRLIFVGLILTTVGYGSLEVGLPVFMSVGAGLGVSFVAVAYAINTGVVVAMQLPSLRLTHGRSRSRLLGVVGVLWALAWFVIGTASKTPPALSMVAIGLGVGVFAIGETILSPVMPSIINDLAPEDLRGRYNSMQSLVWGVSGALGSGIAGVLLGSGLSGLWVAVVCGGCLFAGVAGVRLRHFLTPAQDGRLNQP